jgi:hypothetical protein
MLGCAITRDRAARTLHISQAKAIRALQKKLNFTASANEPVLTPMDQRAVFTKTDCPTEADVATRKQQTEYRSYLMSLMYFARWTMPQITFAVSKLAKVMANPGPVHFTMLKRLLRYVFSHADDGLLYPAQQVNGLKSHAYFDASFADDLDTRRSTYGFAFYFLGCLISWKSKLHNCVTTSTNHTEYAAQAHTAKEAKYFHSVLSFLGFPEAATPVTVYGDNEGSLALAYNPEKHGLNKHIDVQDHFTRELVEAGIIALFPISTESNVADIFTKPLGKVKFTKFAKELIGK